MYNKILKRITSVLGAALALSICFTATPVQAATTAKVGDHYETSYALSDVECFFTPDSATVSGKKIDWTNHWGTVMYKIPQEVLDAGFTGYYINGSSSETGLDLKLLNPDDMWGSAVDNYTNEFGADHATMVDESKLALAVTTGFGIMSLGEDGDATTATIDSVVFITKNSVAGAADGGSKEETKTEDTKTETKPDTSSKTGESTTMVWLVCILGGLFLMAASGMFVTGQKKRR